MFETSVDGATELVFVTIAVMLEERAVWLMRLAVWMSRSGRSRPEA